MKAALFTFCCLMPFLAGCQGIFGTIPGEHWNVVPGAADEKLSPESAGKIIHIVAERLHLKVRDVVPENNGIEASYADIKASDPAIVISVAVYRSESRVALTVLNFDGPFYGRSTNSSAIEKDYAARTLAVLKEIYPNSKAFPFIAYQGLMGP